MSPVGHSLVGVSVAVIVMPQGARLRTWVVGLSAFVVLANLPDLPLPYWGHNDYRLSHSLFLNLAAIALAGIAWLAVPSRWNMPGKCALFTGAALAWLSHLLLDSLYSHGRGIAIFWPLCDSRLNLPIPWFHTLDTIAGYWHGHNLAVVGVELLAYGPLLLLAIAGRRMMRKRRLPMQPAEDAAAP